MSSENKEFEDEGYGPQTYNITLNPDLSMCIDKISKMFQWTPEELIKVIINRELSWVKDQIKKEQPTFLEEYFYRSELKNEILKFLEDL